MYSLFNSQKNIRLITVFKLCLIIKIILAILSLYIKFIKKGEKMRKFFVSSLVSLAVASSLFGAGNFKIITFENVKKIHDESSAIFLDARPAKLYKAGTIPGALNFDIKMYDKMKQFLPADKNAKIISFCNGIKCEHSDNLAIMLEKEGYTNVEVYKGGYPEWSDKKLPLMGIMKECKSETYQPKTPLVTIKGASVYLVKGDKTMIDQFWFASLGDKLPDNVQMIDTRKPEYFKEGHFKGAINLPMNNGSVDESKLPKDKLNVFYCTTGTQSTEAVVSLKNNDGSNVYLDAKVECKGEVCTITPNDFL